MLGCGTDDLDKSYIASGAMGDALYSELETLEIPVMGVLCRRPRTERFACDAFAREDTNGRAAWASYKITNPASARDEGSFTVLTWVARRTAGDTRFPRRIKGWDAVERTAPNW